MMCRCCWDSTRSIWIMIDSWFCREKSDRSLQWNRRGKIRMRRGYLSTLRISLGRLDTKKKLMSWQRICWKLEKTRSVSITSLKWSKGLWTPWLILQLRLCAWLSWSTNLKNSSIFYLLENMETQIQSFKLVEKKRIRLSQIWESRWKNSKRKWKKIKKQMTK